MIIEVPEVYPACVLTLNDLQQSENFIFESATYFYDKWRVVCISNNNELILVPWHIRYRRQQHDIVFNNFDLLVTGHHPSQLSNL